MHIRHGIKWTWIPDPAPSLTSNVISCVHRTASATRMDSWAVSETLGLLSGSQWSECEQSPNLSKAPVSYRQQSKDNNRYYFSENFIMHFRCYRYKMLHSSI